MLLRVVEVPSPLGRVRAVLAGEALCALGFDPQWPDLTARLGRRFGAPRFERATVPAVARAIEAYFAGALGALDVLAVDPGGTPLQAKVWAALRDVPAGSTVTYAELARLVGIAKTASRAVGAANGANPVSLGIPCHRVIGSDGALRGYAGGIDRKRWLLDHERRR